MKQYGLIGKSLKHSLSKSYFEQKFKNEGRFDCIYSPFELTDIETLPEFIKQHPDLQGFTVTIPYKQSIIPLLDELDPEAERIGAVNVVRIFRSGEGIKLKGYNTDAEGFRRSLAGVKIPTQALVLGTGGAAAAIMEVLKQWDIDFRQVSRHSEQGMLAYKHLNGATLAKYPFIINCTPLGTLNQGMPDLPYEALTPSHFLYDLVYNPEKTPFLKEGEKHGCRIQNGLQMLYLQADAAWDIWQAKQRECL